MLGLLLFFMFFGTPAKTGKDLLSVGQRRWK